MSNKIEYKFINRIMYVLFLFFLYIYIFNPPLSFLPLSPKFGLYILFSPILVTKSFYNYVYKFRFFLFCLLALILYSFFRDLPSVSGFVFFPINLLLLFEVFLIPIGFLMCYKFLNRNDLVIEIINVASFSALITLILILQPNLGDFVRYSLLKNDEFTEAVSHRAFGIAESLTYSYGLIQGLMFAMVLLYSNKNRKLLFTLPLFFISVLFNARIGFLPLLLGSFIYFVVNFKIQRILLTTFGLIICYFVIFETNVFVKQKETIQWGLDFFTQISDFSSGKKTESDNTFSTLFGNMLILPHSELEWLIGTGENIFGKKFGKSSDIGYIIQLTYGGLIYLFIIFMLVFELYKIGVQKFYIRKSKYLLFLLVIVMMIANIKGNFFTTVGIFRIVVLIFFWINSSNKQTKSYE